MGLKDIIFKIFDFITFGQYNTGLFYNKKSGYYNWCTAAVSLAMLIVVFTGSIIVLADINDYDTWSVTYTKQASSSVAFNGLNVMD